MLKFVVKKLDQGKSTAGGKRATVRSKRVRDGAGKLVSFRTIDAASSTLTDDLTLAFGRNVERARRENKKVLGVRDIVPVR